MIGRRGFIAQLLQGDAPALRGWQARRIAYGYAVQQERPGYVVRRVIRRSKYRIEVIGNEPGYLGPLEGPDVTHTMIERRKYQLWVRDPFSRDWSRWL